VAQKPVWAAEKFYIADVMNKPSVLLVCVYTCIWNREC